MLFIFPGYVHAGNFRVLYSFTGDSDGGSPVFILLNKKADLYGTTGPDNHDAGAVFKLARDGTETVLHYFYENSHGFGPDGLAADSKGNLWGPLCCGGNASGCGTIFKINPQGVEETVHTFAGSPTDACTSYAAPFIDSKRRLFGTSIGGGKSNDGAVFSLTSRGAERLVHSFNTRRGGYYPSGLVMDANGYFVGTDGYGGPKKSGTVFALSLGGAESVLYAFKGSPNDGAEPLGGVIVDVAGNFYGTMFAGGRAGCWANLGCGGVFILTLDGTESVLHYFRGGKSDGSNPQAGLVADASGNLYGTTEYGGSNCSITTYGCGTVFEVAPNGSETILHKFKGSSDGACPVAALVSDGMGDFYGAASIGGAYGYGTVFEITP
ncbi:MAG: choice-of-anchor tandem repeat GloVer-containing protein [Rhizomicrobium sp.]